MHILSYHSIKFLAAAFSEKTQDHKIIKAPIFLILDSHLYYKLKLKYLVLGILHSAYVPAEYFSLNKIVQKSETL